MGKDTSSMRRAAFVTIDQRLLGMRWRFGLGERVRKMKGSSWQGRVVGFYSTELTPVGYCVESEREPGSVQVWPEAALEAVGP